MPPFLVNTLKYTLISSGLVTSAWAIAVYAQTSQIPHSKIKTLESVSEALRSSTTYTIVNPRATKHAADSRSLTLQTSKPVSESQILSNLFNGFFASYIFLPEALILRCLAHKFTHFSTVESGKAIWSSQQLPSTGLPSRCTLLFGTFQVLNIGHDGKEACHVDFGFGSDQGSFTGFHRLSVERVEEGGLRLGLECASCNPTDDERGSRFSIGKVPGLRTFHILYAELLFRAAVANVVKKLKEENVQVLM